MKISRRRLVKSLLAAGTGAAFFPGRAFGQAETVEGFDASARETLAAACERMFPGAQEAGAMAYIEYWTMREPFLATGREFRLGARHLDRLARERQRKPFAALSPEEQDGILRHLQQGGVRAKNFDGAGFFVRLLSFVVEAVFCDPRYGGNPAVGAALVGRRGCLWNPVAGVSGARGDLPEE
ncbi:MAG: gluconate 2-dehydrogenase subunit 3 family protein [Myxococcales bacterium]|nr:gluconate 2-dehydrogenase subunit 3 family protein [Myxococcales bacterium]